MQYVNIKLLRKEKGLSQEQVARNLNCSQRAYSHYEKGDRDIPTRVLVGLANYFEVTEEYMKRCIEFYKNKYGEVFNV